MEKNSFKPVQKIPKFVLDVESEVKTGRISSLNISNTRPA
jgi:hypothetical protein